MVVSALCTFLIWVVPPQERIVVILSCLFSGVSVAGWNALDVLGVSLFPVQLRYFIELKKNEKRVTLVKEEC